MWKVHTWLYDLLANKMHQMFSRFGFGRRNLQLSPWYRSRPFDKHLQSMWGALLQQLQFRYNNLQWMRRQFSLHKLWTLVRCLLRSQLSLMSVKSIHLWSMQKILWSYQWILSNLWFCLRTLRWSLVQLHKMPIRFFSLRILLILILLWILRYLQHRLQDLFTWVFMLVMLSIIPIRYF